MEAVEPGGSTNEWPKGHLVNGILFAGGMALEGHGDTCIPET